MIEGKRGFGCSGWREGCPFVLWREYRGLPLAEEQVRELLQRRVLLQPVTIAGAGEVILQLMDSGDLTEIPVPTGGPRRQAGNAGRPPSGGRKAPRTARPKKASGATGGAPPREPATGFAPVALGPCPLCKSEVVEQEKSYGCSGWKHGCRFTIWKTIAGKKIGVRTAQLLLREGRSSLLKGFESRSGKPFEARLKLEGAAVRFDFST